MLDEDPFLQEIFYPIFAKYDHIEDFHKKKMAHEAKEWGPKGQSSGPCH